MAQPDIQVRCPSCRGLSEIEVASLGQAVGCPFCDFIFTAYPDAKVRPVREIPVVSAVRKPEESIDDSAYEPPPSSPLPFLIGLALFPLAIPIVWLMSIAAGKQETLFTLAVPLALGFGASGLCLGVALTRDWSTGRKIKSILALSLVAGSTGLGLYGLKKEWVEAVRKRLGADEFNWQVHDAWPFLVKVPPHLKRTKDLEPLLPQWNLEAVRYASSKQPVTDIYRIAHGWQPEQLAPLAADQWFDVAIKEMTTEETGPPLNSQPIVERGYPGREVTFQKSDRATNLTVRLYRVGQAVILLSVEGPLLPADARDVQTFFRSLYIKPANRN